MLGASPVTFYQGRALRREAPAPRPRRGRRAVRVALVALGIALFAHLPWEGLRRKVAVVEGVRVEGLRTLDAVRVRGIAGIQPGQDLFSVDCARARQRLLADSRIERAEVRREWPRGIRVRVVERAPVLLVRHGSPWELDSAGVMLRPLAEGVVADVPMLSGVSFEGVPDGARVSTAEARRGLGWVQALSASDLQLGGRVSEIDVSDARVTALTWMSGTRVLAPAWPPGSRRLSALRAVLADLVLRGTAAREIDLRFADQVIVRPVEPDERAAAPPGPVPRAGESGAVAAGGQAAPEPQHDP